MVIRSFDIRFLQIAKITYIILEHSDDFLLDPADFLPRPPALHALLFGTFRPHSDVSHH